MKLPEVTFTPGDKTGRDLDAWQTKANLWTATAHYAGRSFVCDYWTGPAHPGPTAPELWDSLAAEVVLDDVTFEEWADEAGYDPDSRHAERIFRACVKQTARLRVLFGDDFDAFPEQAHAE